MQRPQLIGLVTKPQNRSRNTAIAHAMRAALARMAELPPKTR